MFHLRYTRSTRPPTFIEIKDLCSKLCLRKIIVKMLLERECFLWLPLVASFGSLSYKSFMVQVLKKLNLGLSSSVFVSLRSPGHGRSQLWFKSHISLVMISESCKLRKKTQTAAHMMSKFKLFYSMMGTMLTLYTLKEALLYQSRRTLWELPTAIERSQTGPTDSSGMSWAHPFKLLIIRWFNYRSVFDAGWFSSHESVYCLPAMITKL